MPRLKKIIRDNVGGALIPAESVEYYEAAHRLLVLLSRLPVSWHIERAGLRDWQVRNERCEVLGEGVSPEEALSMAGME